MKIQRIPSDLSPGDSRALEFDFTGLRVVTITHPSDAHFDEAYQFLWDEFGSRHEVEQKEVLIQRLARDPHEIIRGYSFLYQMNVVLHGTELAAVRDHTAIVPRDDVRQPIIVHLSHLLIAKPWRGTGLTSWMRAWPIQTARRAAQVAGSTDGRDITMVAEMEHLDPSQPATLIRLKSYEKGGFLKVDPAAVNYHQPDFRPLAEIDRTGPRPLPMAMILRRVGHESETMVQGSEVQSMVKALYTMYSLEFRSQDMAELFQEIESYPKTDVRLVPPTSL